jgi:rubrerythrin
MDCGYLLEAEERPGACPDCGATSAWERVAYVRYVDAWECTSCRHISELDRPPRICPECSAVDAWEQVELAETQELDAVGFEFEAGERQELYANGNGSGP